VRQTATRGATILRLRRDDWWIAEMLFWLSKFKHDFVDLRIEPPVDFFWFDEDKQLRDRYRHFVAKTKELGESKVEVVAQVQHVQIQRAPRSGLFLDSMTQ
jgi:hypothetical protein